MENENKGQMSTDIIVTIVVIIAIIIGLYFWLSSGSPSNEVDTVEKPQEEQTLGEQISEGSVTDNPASEVPQTNVFEAETNPFKEDSFKNPFE